MSSACCFSIKVWEKGEILKRVGAWIFDTKSSLAFQEYMARIKSLTTNNLKVFQPTLFIFIHPEKAKAGAYLFDRFLHCVIR
jgi:hypothetical protein